MNILVCCHAQEIKVFLSNKQLIADIERLMLTDQSILKCCRFFHQKKRKSLIVSFILL